MLERTLVLVHRYIGIPMSVVFVVWFASGIVMIYTGGMPATSEAERLAGLPALDLAAVEVAPSEAVQAAGFDPTRMRLVTITGRPAWRLETTRGSTTLFADSDELLGAITPEQARNIASEYLGLAARELQYVRMLEQPDQWTLTLAGALPLMKLAAVSGGKQAYVSVYEGEVVLVTDRVDRMLAWAGAIPHWFYITPLRTNQPVWYWTVVATATLGTLLAVIGLVLGLTQLRSRGTSRSRSILPYAGWMHWHHVFGLVFGGLVLTWVFSGLLSMSPFDWTRIDGAAMPDSGLGPERVDAGQFGEIDAALAMAARRALGAAPREIELVHAAGAPYFLARTAHEIGPALLAAESLQPRTRPFETSALLRHVEAAAGGHAVAEHALLTDYDAYYYARAGEAPLPVLRVKLDDPGSTWLYVDTRRARLVARFNHRERIERWLYYGFHSLDFGFWYDRRPLWDIGVIALSLGGLATSGIGVVLGYRRIRRFVVRRTAPRARTRGI